MQRHALALLSAIAAGLAASPARAIDVIQCDSERGPEIAISLHARTAFGHDLSCIRARFIADMVPCAPAGGFGLSSGAGDLRLVSVVMDWRDREYAGHTGGVTAFLVDESRYEFSGGFHASIAGKEDMEETWRFVVSRVSGTGRLTMKGQPPTMYRCHAAKQKF